MAPSRCSLIALNLPLTGSDRVIVAVTGVFVPSAQLGTQFGMKDLPVPAAPVAVHEDHLIEVTTFPPLPEKPMTAGLVPL